ncbi:MAG: hypothetical protein ACREDK_00620 [Thermoplasmata archaeon]
MALRTAREVQGFRFRRLDKPEERRAVEEVHAVAFGPAGEPAVPASVQRTLQDHGGLVLGAFADIYLAGFAVGLLGWDGTSLYHYAVATAVRPEYQNHHVGFRLKAFQRDEVLAQGLPRIRGAFDPLESRTAFLLVRRLGARPDRFLPHYFGRRSDAPDAGDESDRVGYAWELAEPRTVERLAGGLPAPEEDRDRWARSVAIVETEVGDSGIRLPTAVVEPSAAHVHLEIPFDLKLVLEHEPASVRRWRHAVRDAFRAAFDIGYRVVDFAVVTAEHERRSAYFLVKDPSPTPTAGGRTEVSTPR